MRLSNVVRYSRVGYNRRTRHGWCSKQVGNDWGQALGPSWCNAIQGKQRNFHPLFLDAQTVLERLALFRSDPPPPLQLHRDIIDNSVMQQNTAWWLLGESRAPLTTSDAEGGGEGGAARAATAASHAGRLAGIHVFSEEEVRTYVSRVRGAVPGDRMG